METASLGTSRLYINVPCQYATLSQLTMILARPGYLFVVKVLDKIAIIEGAVHL